jgi:hypothetical protein
MIELSRKMWRTLEPVHGMIYFAAEAAEEYARAGVSDARSAYFASRGAPLGRVPAEVVVATFFNFDPRLVHGAIPRSWDEASPAMLLAARLTAADRALRRLLGAATVDSPEMGEAAALARAAASESGMRPDGRPLYAAHASLPWPEEPHLILWHAITLLREYRGDGHIAMLVAEGITGIEALILHAAVGEIPAAVLQGLRGWSDEAWAAGRAGLQQRGLIDERGAFTEAGRIHRQWVEDRTDQAALAPWVYLGDERCGCLRELVRPWSRAITEAGTFLRPPGP